VLGATEAGAWSFTDALRLELAEQGNTVLGYVLGSTRTSLGDSFHFPRTFGSNGTRPRKSPPRCWTLFEAGESERILDDIGHAVKVSLTSDPSRYQAILGGRL
jgi:short-subunit dehydrogenase